MKSRSVRQGEQQPNILISSRINRTDDSSPSGIKHAMGSHFSRTDTTQTRSRYGTPKVEQHNDLSLPTAPTVYEIDCEPHAQLATEASIRIGPYALTFALAQRIAQDLRNSNLSPAVAEVKPTSNKLHSGPDLSLYDFKLQLLDDCLILLNQSWIELPPALSDVLGKEHMATLFDRAHGCCVHAAHDKDLAFISGMGIEVVGRNRMRKCMCVEINYACRCSTLFMCRSCPSQLLFSRHQLRDGRMMLVTTNWRNLGQCRDISDDTWRSQTTGLNLLSTASHKGQSRFDAPEWEPLKGFSGVINYGGPTTSRMRDIADKGSVWGLFA